MKNDVYFNSFSEAVQYAYDEVVSRGYEIDQDDWAREITFGKGRPKAGETTRATVGLVKDGKPQRKALAIQVYNRETSRNAFELNFYVN